MKDDLEINSLFSKADDSPKKANGDIDLDSIRNVVKTFDGKEMTILL